MDYAQPGLALSGESLLEDVHQAMLQGGMDFAVVIDEERHVLALASFKRIASVLSAKYGQALFSRRQLGATRVHSRIVGAAQKNDEDGYLSVVTPLKHTIILHPEDDFFEAQRRYELRPVENHFDDIILVDRENRYAGLLPVREFNRLQHQMLLWQESELVERNHKLERTLEELSRTQEELITAAKMASLGELVAGITHEMNTPLGILLSSHEMIGSLADQMRGESGADKVGSRYARLIRGNIELGRESGERLSSTIESLRLFGKGDSETPQQGDLIAMIEGTLVLLANQIDKGVRIEKDYPAAGTAFLLCHAGQLSQVFAHILSNAIQAMKGSGQITLSVRRSDNDWQLRIHDSGPGISPEILSRIFDPGFTTKGVGVGTGLGLSISKKIIEMNHKGKIRAENHPDGGAVFCIDLPIRVEMLSGERRVAA
jgi:signal transduction histidine kinase